MSMIRFLGIQFQRIHFGTIVYAKIGAVINLLIFLQVYNFSNTVKIIVAIGGIFILWFVGFVSSVTGFKDEYEREQQRVIIQEFNNEKSRQSTVEEMKQ